MTKPLILSAALIFAAVSAVSAADVGADEGFTSAYSNERSVRTPGAPESAFAQAPRTSAARQNGIVRTAPSHDAYDQGRRVGADPDEIIRLELMRDPAARRG